MCSSDSSVEFEELKRSSFRILKRKITWRLVFEIGVLENVFVVFDSVERHLVESDFARRMQKGAGDSCWTREDEFFVESY